jgi:hypothetical protein
MGLLRRKILEDLVHDCREMSAPWGPIADSSPLDRALKDGMSADLRSPSATRQSPRSLAETHGFASLPHSSFAFIVCNRSKSQKPVSHYVKVFTLVSMTFLLTHQIDRVLFLGPGSNRASLSLHLFLFTFRASIQHRVKKESQANNEDHKQDCQDRHGCFPNSGSTFNGPNPGGWPFGIRT